MNTLKQEGFTVFSVDQAVARWADAAHKLACEISRDPKMRATNLRHGETWFVGVDTLPNAADGSVSGIPLAGAWQAVVPHVGTWHPAQLSITYPGYPGRDPGESDAAHRYRRDRCAAHVDGLIPVGPDRRRHLLEPHAFILGLPLTDATCAPLTVWPGSHKSLGSALRGALAGRDEPAAVDITDAYVSARRDVLQTVAPKQVVMQAGQAVLLHRHLLHGVGQWPKGRAGPSEGRMVAYFRPLTSAATWLAED